MEEIIRWYKNHLCGFNESFEKDVAVKFMDELETMFEYVVSAMIDDYNIYSSVESNKTLFEDYIKKRSNEVIEDGEKPWYTEDIKVTSRYLPGYMQPIKQTANEHDK